MTIHALPTSGPLALVLERLSARGPVRRSGKQYKACCPAHDDHDPSLDVTEGTDGRVLVTCWSNRCSFDAIAAALGLQTSDFFPPRVSTAYRAAPAPRRIEKTYDYRDAQGQLLFQVVRLDPKRFLQRRPLPGGGWEWSLGDVQPVLYRLPEVRQAVAEGRPVFVVEGEKDADALCALGYVATTAPMGATKWRDAYGAALAGAEVIILPDNDDAGRAHGAQVAASCGARGCAVRTVTLPGLPPKGDVSDWLAAGGTREALDAIVAATPRAEDSPPPPSGEDERPAGYSDDALALAFAARHADELRHVAQQHRWLWFRDGRWCEDTTLTMFEAARALSRELVDRDALSGRSADALRSAKTVAAVVSLARSDARIAAVPDQFDRDSLLLNTPGGVVDLRTGACRASRADDYLTKQTAVPLGQSDGCARWLAFLRRVTGADSALERFLQVMAGYCLTGDVSAHALFFLYGTGGNGKGVFLNTLTRVLGDYARVAPIDTFTASSGDRHPTDLAMLRGARLVISQETEEGRRWAESKIKSLTGGDPITARFMRGDFFTYEPQFKLVIAGNHRPGLRSVDEAIRRRFHLIPFEQKIAPAERDPDLPEKLRAEWPDILAWAVDGCAMWLEEGLRPPSAVQAATDDYFTAEDAFQAWVDDCCTVSSVQTSTSAELYASWKAWAERAGEVPGSAKRFGTTLEQRGFEPIRDRSGRRAYRGLSVNPNSPAAYLHAS